MKQLLTLLIFLGGLLPFSGLSQPETVSNNLTIGDQLHFHSDILGEKRTLNVYLPLSYHPDSSHLYPVIYLLDGSMNEDFMHISGLTQFSSFSWINLMPESIVVGIANIDRKHDFTFPTENQEMKTQFPTTGGSAGFIRFLQEEVIPMISARYHCNDSRTLLGQSLGGLLASEILLTHPDMFSNYLIVSPSLWWDDQSLLGKEVLTGTSACKVFIAVGKEGKVMVRDAKSLNKKLSQSSNAPQSLYFRYFPEHNHGDILHSAATAGFTFLFQSPK